MLLEDGPLYAPEQVSDNGWLGKRSPGALRKAAARGQLEHTISGGKICFSYANIRANQEAGLVQARTGRRTRMPSAGRRPRRSAASVAALPSGEKRSFTPRPEARRRRDAS